MPVRLTVARLEAMAEALIARTAGEIDIEGEDAVPCRDDYEKALEWVLLQIRKRQAKAKGTRL